MRVDVHQPDRLFFADRAQDRMRDRMIAADRQRHRAGRHHPLQMLLDVLVTGGEIEATAERHVANVGHVHVEQRRRPEHVLERPDPLDRAHGPGP